MAKSDLLDRVAAGDADISAIADQFIINEKQIPLLVGALRSEQSSKRYSFEKALRLISERRPDLIYPYFDFFSALLENENSFLKWGAIQTIANLTAADTERKFEKIFMKYYAPIGGTAMITAANVIRSSVKIARAKPEMIDSITAEILKIEKARFQLKGRPSPECRNVAIGHAIGSLEELYGRIADKAEVVKFVKRHLRNPRKQVAKKAETFLRKHEPTEITPGIKNRPESARKSNLASAKFRRQTTI